MTQLTLRSSYGHLKIEHRFQIIWNTFFCEIVKIGYKYTPGLSLHQEISARDHHMICIFHRFIAQWWKCATVTTAPTDQITSTQGNVAVKFDGQDYVYSITGFGCWWGMTKLFKATQTLAQWTWQYYCILHSSRYQLTFNCDVLGIFTDGPYFDVGIESTTGNMLAVWRPGQT